MKTYTFDINNKKTNNNSFLTNIGINYSKVLDDLIAADIEDKNYYLKSYSKKDDIIDNIIYSSATSNTTDFAKAAKFLANYKKSKKHPYKLNTVYYLSDGTPIMFFEDSIQIGFDLYYFDDFDKDIFLGKLTPSMKETIITIYTDGLKISIIK